MRSLCIIFLWLLPAISSGKVVHLNPFFSQCKLLDFPVVSETLGPGGFKPDFLWAHLGLPIEITNTQVQPTEISPDGQTINAWVTIDLVDKQDGLRLKIRYFSELPSSTATGALKPELEVFDGWFKDYAKVISERYSRQWSKADIEDLIAVTYESRDRTHFAEVLDERRTNLGTFAVTLAPFTQVTLSKFDGEGKMTSQESQFSSDGMIKQVYLPHLKSEIESKKPFFGDVISVPMWRKNPKGVLKVPLEDRGFSVERRASEILTLPNPSGGLLTFGEGIVFEPRFFSKNVPLLLKHPEVNTKLDLYFLSYIYDPQFSDRWNRSGRSFGTFTAVPRLYERYGFERNGEEKNVLGKPHYGLSGEPEALLRKILDFQRIRESKDYNAMRKMLDE